MVLGEAKAEAGLGGTDDGVCENRELWWLVSVVLADPDLKNCSREGRGASWVSEGYPTGEDKNALMREEGFQCANDHCEVRWDVGLYIQKE